MIFFMKTCLLSLCLFLIAFSICLPNPLLATHLEQSPTGDRFLKRRMSIVAILPDQQPVQPSSKRRRMPPTLTDAQRKIVEKYNNRYPLDTNFPFNEETALKIASHLCFEDLCHLEQTCKNTHQYLQNAPQYVTLINSFLKWNNTNQCLSPNKKISAKTQFMSLKNDSRSFLIYFLYLRLQYFPLKKWNSSLPRYYYQDTWISDKSAKNCFQIFNRYLKNPFSHIIKLSPHTRRLALLGAILSNRYKAPEALTTKHEHFIQIIEDDAYPKPLQAKARLSLTESRPQDKNYNPHIGLISIRDDNNADYADRLKAFLLLITIDLASDQDITPYDKTIHKHLTKLLSKPTLYPPAKQKARLLLTEMNYAKFDNSTYNFQLIRQELAGVSQHPSTCPEDRQQARFTFALMAFYGEGLAYPDYNTAHPIFLETTHDSNAKPQMQTKAQLLLALENIITQKVITHDVYHLTRERLTVVIKSQPAFKIDQADALFYRAKMDLEWRHYDEALTGFDQFLKHPAANATDKIAAQLNLGIINKAKEKHDYDQARQWFYAVLQNLSAPIQDRIRAMYHISETNYLEHVNNRITIDEILQDFLYIYNHRDTTDGIKAKSLVYIRNIQQLNR